MDAIFDAIDKKKAEQEPKVKYFYFIKNLGLTKGQSEIQ